MTPSQKRVLVVDDHSDAADSLVVVLANMGYVAYALYSPEHLLEKIKALQPPLVLMIDTGLSSQGRYAVVSELRKEFSRDELYLVAVTGSSQTSDRILSRQAGFDAHLAKPIDCALLERVLGSLDQN